jgi:uncharacterized protein YidB (DUF937 family)
MGLLDIAEGLMGEGQTGGANEMITSVVQTLNSQPGGLSGVLDSLQRAGLGEAVSSWIGTGANASVTGETLQSALGSGVVQDLASKLGVSPTDASSHLAELLPGIIDHLTPNGAAPEGGLSGAGLDFVKGFLSRNLGA